MHIDSENSVNADQQSPPGVVELREDVPLKAGTSLGDSGSRCCGGGPRFILGCFAALSAGITVALLTQIYYGDYEVVPHGAVSSSAANCSETGTKILKAGGNAMDAAVATAVCLTVFAPHRTSLDASGSLLYWEYRTSHTQPPTLSEWGGPDTNINGTERPPKLLAALASLHSEHGVLPWSEVLQPAIDFARNGFKVSEGLAAAAAARGAIPMEVGALRSAPQLGAYLQKFQQNTSSELASAWGGHSMIRSSSPHASLAGKWRMYAGGTGADVAGKALGAALLSPLPDSDFAFQNAVTTLLQASQVGGWPPIGVSTGLAVIDRFDNYVALVTGLSKSFGSGPVTQDGWLRDEPALPLDLAPAIIVDNHICGTRYVIGAESSSALAQGAAALLVDTGKGAGAVEDPRVSVYTGGVLGIESARIPPLKLPAASVVLNATLPYAAVNVVQQHGDALASYADSRGGGLSSRF